MRKTVFIILLLGLFLIPCFAHAERDVPKEDVKYSMIQTGNTQTGIDEKGTSIQIRNASNPKTGQRLTVLLILVCSLVWLSIVIRKNKGIFVLIPLLFLGFAIPTKAISNSELILVEDSKVPIEISPTIYKDVD